MVSWSMPNSFVKRMRMLGPAAERCTISRSVVPQNGRTRNPPSASMGDAAHAPTHCGCAGLGDDWAGLTPRVKAKTTSRQESADWRKDIAWIPPMSRKLTSNLISGYTQCAGTMQAGSMRYSQEGMATVPNKATAGKASDQGFVYLPLIVGDRK